MIKFNKLDRNQATDPLILQNAKSNYTSAKNFCNRLVRSAKNKLFGESVNNNFSKPDKLWQSLRQLGVLSINNTDFILPPLEELNSFFASHNNAVVDMSLIDAEINSLSTFSIYPSFILHHIEPSTVLKYMNSISTNCKGIDGINIKMLDLCLPFCLNIITHIVNFSISCNAFPSLWKNAFVTPIPKVDVPSDITHFRPISILPTISKVLEKVVAEQMCRYLDDHELWNPNLSGFRKSHSTATALLKIVNDMVEALDRGDVTVLALLDFSKAFDTVNHALLLQKLKVLGFMDHTLTWFKSYLTGRKHCVIDNDKQSGWVDMDNGVPQGSILGPILFVMLTQDISSIISTSSHHLYADDTQLYCHSSLPNLADLITNLNSDLDSIQSWSRRNALHLNTSKCKYIIIGSPHHINLINNNIPPVVKINDTPLPKVAKCRNLGVIFDEVLSWEPHINSLLSKSYFKLKSLYRFKNFLSTRIKLQLCESLILSNFNYCSVLFGNITGVLHNKIQKVQNSCLRFSFSLNKRDHISQALNSSKWLNMSNRFIYHSMVLIYKIVHNLAPNYLHVALFNSLIVHNYPTRSSNLLPIPTFSCRTKEHFFFVSAVRNFNQLPVDILSCVSVNSFKINLKKLLLARQTSSQSSHY